MEPRPDTSSSSGRFRGQWSFLANPPQHGQPRSLPPSSYIPHSDRSSISPLPNGVQYQAALGGDGSRSSLPRNLTTASIGARSSVTIPSQPVLIRVHSADASAHTNPAPRPRRPINMNKSNGLPAISEFSIQGILAAIQEDVESDINTIAEILGRSRLVLADQHDSHMPPQGEIRANQNSLQVVDETSVSGERLVMDDVLILREDASLVDGSQAGSAAYGLLERLQAVPRASRIRNNTASSRNNSLPNSPMRIHSSPAVLRSDLNNGNSTLAQSTRLASTRLLQTSTVTAPARTTPAIVSESHLSAEANGNIANHLSTIPELYDHDYDLPGFDVEASESIDHVTSTNPSQSPRTLRERMQSLMYVSDPTGLSAWLQGQNRAQDSTNGPSAEAHLRDILGR